MPQQPDFQAQFEAELARLNPEQLEAVKSISGPVLLLAGPGAGKTQVLSLRIANILLQTDTPPTAILALTYTEAAARNMQRRLARLIGAVAYQVQITTFHGLGSDIIRDYPEYFKFRREATQIDDLSRTQLLKELIDESELELLTNFHNPYIYLRDITAKIAELKRQGLTPAEFSQAIERAEQKLATNAEHTRTGKLKPAWRKLEKTIAKNRELLGIYEKFQQRLLEESLYDYADMIVSVSEQISAEPELKANLQERFLYFLVDEYQDTNQGQLELIGELTAGVDSPNFFAVGDEDQAIFSFQGANIYNILQFGEHYPNSKIITTRLNYRSQQTILTAASGVIANNKERAENYNPQLKKELIAARKNQKPAKIQLHKFSTSEQELTWLIERIKAEQNESESSTREIAVIVRDNKESQLLTDYLTQAGVPTASETRSNLLHDGKIIELLELIEFLLELDRSDLLAKILHRKTWELDQIQLYSTLREYSELSPGNSKSNQKPTLIEFMSSHSNTDFTDVVAKISNLRSEAITNSAPEALKIILAESGFIDRAIAAEDYSSLRLYNQLVEFSTSRLALSGKNYSLADFFRDLKATEEDAVSIPVASQPLANLDQGRVYVVTAHKAKGREFDIVFVPKLIDKYWSNRRVTDKLALVDLFEHTEIIEPHSLEEERRLFFVALTRARDSVFLSHADSYAIAGSVAKAAAPAQFISELTPESYTIVEGYEQIVDEVVALQPINHQTNLSNAAKAELSELVANYALSFSGFKNYQESPEKFLLENLLSIPQPQADSQILGSIVHGALELIHRELAKSSATNIKPLEISHQLKLSSRLEKRLELTGISPERQVKILLEAEKLIEPFLGEETNFNHSQISAVERSYKKVFWEGIPLSGKIDLIETTKSGLKLIDFKTGSPKSRNQLLGISSAEDYVHDYYKQLLFYFILAKSDSKITLPVTELELRFVKPMASGRFKVETFTPDPADILELETEVRTVYDQIKNLEF